MKLTAVAVLVAVGVILCVWVSGAYAHDAAAMSDTRRGAWFESLKVPNTNGSCCNLEDCEQTQARQLPDQTWVAVMHDLLGSRWVAIPSEKVIKKPLSIDGEAYICNSKGSSGGLQYSPGGGGSYMSTPSRGLIYCFVPPIPGY